MIVLSTPIDVMNLKELNVLVISAALALVRVMLKGESPILP